MLPAMKKVFISLGLLLQVCVFFGQDLPKVIPPSPTVSAFQRYGEMQIGYYTGTANVNIPIYQIQSGDISLPISIAYNTSGVRVADEASNIGLGSYCRWSIIARNIGRG